MQELSKFDRRYYIEFEIGKLDLSSANEEVYIPEETFTIKYPITIEFDITRRISGVTNNATFRLFNLDKKHRNKLWLDEREASLMASPRYIKVKFYAGYSDGILPLVFQGRATYAYSYKQGGDTEWITEIPANDIYDILLYGYDSLTMNKGTSIKTIMQEIAKKVPIVNVGYISNKIPNIKSTQTFTGNPLQILRYEYPDYEIFSDLGELHMIGNNEVIPGQLPVITSASGLLGTPRRRGDGLTVEMIFEPRLCLAQIVVLQVATMPFMNGNYKLLEVRHAGVISPNTCGRAITTMTCSLTNNTVELKKEENKYETPIITNTNFTAPIKGKLEISSHYDEVRINPITKTREVHKGIDIKASSGTPVLATANGVCSVGYTKPNGNFITIEHGKLNNVSISSKYLHLSRVAVTSNQKVTKGQTIGYVGSTGWSTGPHLDFRIYENNKPVNPKKYIGIS